MCSGNKQRDETAVVCCQGRGSCNHSIGRCTISRYTQKQIDKFNRQKYMTELEKIGKNLFRLFRNSESTSEVFMRKFTALKEKLDQKEAVRLESEYHQLLKAYIERLYRDT